MRVDLFCLVKIYDYFFKRYLMRLKGDQFRWTVSMSFWTGRYANVDRHLAVHQKQLILIRLSDYSAAAARDGDVRVQEIILPVW